MLLFKNGTVLVEKENGFCFEKADIQVDEGKITSIGENLVGGEVIDCEGKLIVPGLFDIHTHGAVGIDYTLADSEGLAKIAKYEAEQGVTSLLATVMTAPKDWFSKACTTIGKYCDDAKSGENGDVAATIRGIHLEGPFFSLKKCGAQPPEWIKEPSLESVREWDALSGGRVKLVDVAPEVDGAIDFIKEASKEYVISVAHTAADYDTTVKAFENGADHATHLYNAMTPMTHREPGVVGAVLDSENVVAELIGDGHHIHPMVIRMTFNILGKRVVLISDSLSVTGGSEDDTYYDVSGRPVYIRGGKAVLPDGVIAGASVSLMEDVRRVISFGIPAEDAFYAASYAPAKCFGMENEIGGIKVGKQADFSITDSDWQIDQVWIAGKAVKA